MSETESDPQPRLSGFWPLSIVCLSLFIVLAWQMVMSLQARSNLRAQFEQRKQLVEQSTRAQGSLEAFVNDLLTLAETDKDAKALVEKYQIRRNAPAGGAAETK
jgi:cell division protein FtsB